MRNEVTIKRIIDAWVCMGLLGLSCFLILLLSTIPMACTNHTNYCNGFLMHNNEKEATRGLPTYLYSTKYIRSLSRTKRKGGFFFSNSITD